MLAVPRLSAPPGAPSPTRKQVRDETATEWSIDWLEQAGAVLMAKLTLGALGLGGCLGTAV